MATNLLIGDAGLVLDGATALGNALPATGLRVSNLFGGNKTDRFERLTAGSGDTRFTFNGNGENLAADFLYIGGAATLAKNYVDTVTVKGHSSNDHAAATTVTTLSSFTTATLLGPSSEDYIATFSQASYPYWFVNFNATADSLCAHQKLFLGKAFDPGRDPNKPIEVKRQRATGGRRRAAYTLSFKWEGMAYAKAVEMYSRFYRNRRHSPVVLFTTDYHPVLLGARVLFGRIVAMSAPPRVTGLCNVSMTFEEVV